MTSRQGRQAIAATAAMGVAVALALPTAAFAQSATQGKETATTTSSGTTYYVSSAHGDDANAGTSENAPWKSLTKVNDIASDLGPGDSVLLEYGSEFNDQYLHIKDTAGNADAPITISAYGDADEGKPVIASNGVKGSQWEQDYRANVGNHKNKGTVSTTLLLKDVSYITVSNLEITNDDADVYDPIDTWKWTDTPDSDGTKLDRSASRMDRTGVAGIAENGATMSNVTLDNLYIHDVDGNIYNKHMANGGIYFMAHYPMENTSAETDAGSGSTSHASTTSPSETAPSRTWIVGASPSATPPTSTTSTRTTATAPSTTPSSRSTVPPTCASRTTTSRAPAATPSP